MPQALLSQLVNHPRCTIQNLSLSRFLRLFGILNLPQWKLRNHHIHSTRGHKNCEHINFAKRRQRTGLLLGTVNASESGFRISQKWTVSCPSWSSEAFGFKNSVRSVPVPLQFSSFTVGGLACLRMSLLDVAQDSSCPISCKGLHLILQ